MNEHTKLEVEALLDYLVYHDFQHYETQASESYTPSGKSHFYIKGSPLRFTSREIIEQFLIFMEK